MRRYDIIVTIILLISGVSRSSAQAIPPEEMLVIADSTLYASQPVAADTVLVDSVAKPHRNLLQRVIDYFSETEEEVIANANKKFRVSILGGPNFSSDTGFGIGLAGVATYRLNGCDAPMQPSSQTLFANYTTKGFWSVGVQGTTLFLGERMRMNSELVVNYSPRRFWGIGYERGEVNDGYTGLHQYDARVLLEMLFGIHGKFYVGPAVRWDYARSGETERIELFEGQDRVVRNYGFGVVALYDSRDVMTNAYSGWYVYLGQLFRPKFLANHYSFSTTDIKLCHYRSLWTGGVLAGEIRSTFNFGNPSWAMMSLLGTPGTMRGYYKGRYRDKHITTVQVELRQRVYKRSGLVVWGGGGSVYHDSESFKHWLPNYGIGYRFEFRNRVNVRLDYGFGKGGQNGFLFHINEAF